MEAEEVGVEHLLRYVLWKGSWWFLRDVKDTNVSTLATRINDKVSSLQSLTLRLQEMNDYLSLLDAGTLPVNNTVWLTFQLTLTNR